MFLNVHRFSIKIYKIKPKNLLQGFQGQLFNRSHPARSLDPACTFKRSARLF